MHLAFADRTWEREDASGPAAHMPAGGAAGAGLFFRHLPAPLHPGLTPPPSGPGQQQKQFVADASHELKTPLTVILANAGILLAHSGDIADGQRKWVEYIQAEAQRMKSLVEDLLSLARS